MATVTSLTPAVTTELEWKDVLDGRPKRSQFFVFARMLMKTQASTGAGSRLLRRFWRAFRSPLPRFSTRIEFQKVPQPRARLRTQARVA
jgi:hypothetical protein